MIFISNELQYMGGLKKTTKEQFKIKSVTSGTGNNTYTAGIGKGITFENPYITPTQVQEIYNRVVDYEYLPCEVQWRGNPASESGDVVKVEDIKNNEYRAFVCNSSISLGGGVSATVESIGTTDAIIQFDNITPTEKKVIELQNSIRSQTELINGSNGGVFEIQDTNDDGVNDGWNLWTDETHKKGIVARPTGIGLTSNGGVTYENAITHEGINATALTTGTIDSVKYTSQGSKTFYADDYTQADEDRLHDIVLQTITPTTQDYEKYDFNRDGALNITDFLICKILRQGTRGKWYKNSWTVTIDPKDDDVIKVVQKTKYETKPETTARTTTIKSGGIESRGFKTSDGVTIGLDSNYSIYAPKDCYTAGTFISGSLEKLKTNIAKAPPSLEKVKNSEVYIYNLKAEKDEENKHYGFVIGDKYKTPKEVISKNGDGIDTYSMCSILWKAVQELTQKVESLEDKLNEYNNNKSRTN